MKRTIVSAEARENLLYTVVDFELSDGTKVRENVPHFQPASVAEIEQGLANRLVSEDAKAKAAAKCKDLLPLLSIGVAVDVTPQARA